jgi:hypothetical protein
MAVDVGKLSLPAERAADAARASTMANGSQTRIAVAIVALEAVWFSALTFGAYELWRLV